MPNFSSTGYDGSVFSGFYVRRDASSGPGGWRFPLDMADDTQYAATSLRLSEAVNMLSCLQEGGDGLTYYEADGDLDYRTGAETRLAFHLPQNATGASIGRVQRLLKSRRLI